jgi:hypothetical protein
MQLVQGYDIRSPEGVKRRGPPRIAKATKQRTHKPPSPGKAVHNRHPQNIHLQPSLGPHSARTPKSESPSPSPNGATVRSQGRQPMVDRPCKTSRSPNGAADGASGAHPTRNSDIPISQTLQTRSLSTQPRQRKKPSSQTESAKFAPAGAASRIQSPTPQSVESPVGRAESRGRRALESPRSGRLGHPRYAHVLPKTRPTTTATQRL